MAKGFVYRGADRTSDSITRRSQQAGSTFDSYIRRDVPTFKPKVGDNTVRIMPGSWEDTDTWGDSWEIGVWVHFNVGPDNGSYLCLAKMKDEVCPVCEARRNASDEDEADQLKHSFRNLCWVIDRDNEKAGPQVWGVPITLWREVMSRSVDKKTNAPILIDHPEDGYDVGFTRTGAGLKTKYTAVEIMRDPSPLHEDERIQKRWLDYIATNPLPDVLNYYEGDYIEKVLFGKAPSKRDEEEVEAPLPSRTRRAAAPEPEPEDDPEPVSPRSARRGKPVEPAPEEEEPPFEADPEPEPAPRSRRRALLDAEEEPETPRRGRREVEEAAEPVASARRSLERLRPPSRR